MSLPPDATDPPPSLDPAAIDKLRELDPTGKQQVVQRVLNAYEQSLERMLGELRAARPVRNLDTIARIAHTLKSSSASVGALALSRRCAEAEKVLRSADEGRWDAELDSLLHEGDRALVAVRAMLHS
jgi:HPt (histidine-containing phosphotransfer) domain-containing protein